MQLRIDHSILKYMYSVFKKDSGNSKKMVLNVPDLNKQTEGCIFAVYSLLHFA